MPLYVASENGHEAVAKLLLENIAAIDAKLQDGSMPLHAASLNV
jgi:ankyrin repeat protein